MKLFCIQTTVVKGGKIVERGQSYDTGDTPRKEDKEAYDLISTGRMVEAKDTAAVETATKQIEAEKATKSKADKGK